MRTAFSITTLRILSSLWIVFSFYQWLFMYKDYSQFIFAIGLGILGFYIAHNEKGKQEMQLTQEEILNDKIEGLWKEVDDINKAMDSMNNSFQTKLEIKK